MELKENENDQDEVESVGPTETIPVDDWDRPDDWQRISSDDLPEPDYDEKPMPGPEDLTELQVDKS